VGQKKLLNHFGSVRRLLLAEVAEIGSVIGPKEAEVVYGFIHENEKLELNSQDCYTETQGQKNENSTDE
jgi:ERCC4-type nuclease